ncbi:MAG: AAA family ATPase [Candidatus Competibacteraceae bacterium]
MPANLDRICDAAAERGEQIQRRILEHLEHGHANKTLPDFTIQRAADLLGVSISQVRTLETSGRLPSARTRQAGTIAQRVYNYNDINRLRATLGERPARPDGSAAVSIVFSNLKGGVAKTTHAVHCAQYLAIQGYRVLLIDADPQATVTATFGILPDIDLGETDNLGKVLLETADAITTVIRTTYWDNLDLIPASLSLQRVDFVIAREAAIVTDRLAPLLLRLRAALQQVAGHYDIIVVDTLPALGMLSLNAIAAANLLIIPIEPHMYSLGSSVQYFRILRDVIRRHRDSIQVQRINMLLTRVDEQSPETQGVIKLLTSAYGGMCLSNPMPLTRELQRAATDHLGLYEIDQPRGSRETFTRALQRMDRVNAEILAQVRSLWELGIQGTESSSARPSVIGDMI